MSVRSIVTKINLALALQATIASNTVTLGSAVDGADDELGLAFFISLVWTDGDYVLSLEDSADDGSGAPLGDWTAIPANQIVHGGSDDPAIGGVTASPSEQPPSATTALLENQTKIGVFSERRWVRPVITSTNFAATGAVVTVNVAKMSEYLAA